MRRPRRHLRWLVASAAAGLLLSLPSAGRAVDDAEDFLEALRQRGQYDVALDYLESLRADSRIDAEFQAAIDYEAGVTLIEAARTNPDLPLREKQLAAAKSRFDRFLQEQPKHAEAPNAARQLPNLLVERGKIKVLQSESDSRKPAEKKQLLADARGLYAAAGKLCAVLEKQTLEELRKFPKQLVKGSKEYEEYQRVRQRLLAVRVALAAVPYEIARTHPADSDGRKQSLTTAAQKFGDLYEKYSALLAGLYARLEQARCYKELGQTAKVFEVVEELLAQPDRLPEFRTLKIKALRLALETAVDDKTQGQYANLLAKYQAFGGKNDGAEPPAAPAKINQTKDFEMFLAKLSDHEKDATFQSLFWVADAFFSLGSRFDPPGTKTLNAEAQNYYRKAADTYENMLKHYDEPDFAAPKGSVYSIKLRLARSYARLGRDEKDDDGANSQRAIGLLLEILQAKNAMVDAQKEAAYTYQAWGDIRPEYYQFAIAGNPKHREIWGWGPLAKRAMNNADFQDLFYEARYNLALCRFQQALTKDGEAQTATLRKALRDISTVQTLHPELGGIEWYDKFNELFQNIQTALGEKAAGLPPSDVEKPAEVSEK